MAKITVPSGAEVIINVAPFKDAKKLKNAIERELAIGGGMSFSAALMIDSSDAVDAALAPCLVRCLYNNEKITDQTFDDAKARGDYHEVVMACIKENLGPLAAGLLSKLHEHGLVTKRAADTEEGQKSE